MTGVRCTDSRTRAGFWEIEEREPGLIKLNPILIAQFLADVPSRARGATGGRAAEVIGTHRALARGATANHHISWARPRPDDTDVATIVRWNAI